MVTDTLDQMDPREHLSIGPMGFRLALSNLTLDDLKRSKVKVMLFDVKYVTNCNSYDVGSTAIMDTGHGLYFG